MSMDPTTDLELGKYVQEEGNDDDIDTPLNPNVNPQQVSSSEDHQPILLPKFKATIIGTETREEDPEHQSLIHDNRYTVYEIKVVNENDASIHFVFRRFSEFANLKNKLAEKYPERVKEIEAMEHIFPKSTWFWTNKLSKEVVEQRREKLDELLKFICSDSVFSGDERFYEFLQCDMKMLEKALGFFRNKLYHYQQSRKDLKDKQEYERSQEMVRQLTRKRSESLSKMKGTQNTNSASMVHNQHHH
ncbi:hypothetical protein C9374_007923 [Naegleria lovaniensis]|uniref:PX domain-containing protein n=1 Tax=Naegleria lovaniensis TaxID=51637 RepID=A0AA88KGN2_NAELO|nr:uncharacterized protein C9374_007923 [Naegleria lovaniensis]KAG2378775.1 hypothetical protein C9374_007923 [Naegleria lovaniensis]